MYIQTICMLWHFLPDKAISTRIPCADSNEHFYELCVVSQCIYTKVILQNKNITVKMKSKSYVWICCLGHSVTICCPGHSVRMCNKKNELLLTVPGWYFFMDLTCFFLSCVCYTFVRVCLYVPCGHLLGKG